LLDAVLRPVKDRALAPVAQVVGWSLHPNTLSLLGFAAGLGCAATLAFGPSGTSSVPTRAVALALWLLGRVIDGLDGAVARRQGRASDVGGYLDIMLDFVVYALVPIAAVYGGLSDSVGLNGGSEERTLWLCLALLLGTFYVNGASWMYLAALLEKRSAGATVRGEQTSVAMPTGLIEGSETILLYTLYILFPGALTLLFALTAVFVWITIAQRAIWASRALR
jgi:phosphatidylglycerophosphate synthase